MDLLLLLTRGLTLLPSTLLRCPSSAGSYCSRWSLLRPTALKQSTAFVSNYLSEMQQHLEGFPDAWEAVAESWLYFQGNSTYVQGALLLCCCLLPAKFVTTVLVLPNSISNDGEESCRLYCWVLLLTTLPLRAAVQDKFSCRSKEENQSLTKKEKPQELQR